MNYNWLKGFIVALMVGAGGVIAPAEATGWVSPIDLRFIPQSLQKL